MVYLLQAFKSHADVSLATETMSDAWPSGLAYQVMEKLMEVYQPKDMRTVVELYKKLGKVSMKPKVHPKTLFDQVAWIEHWYNTGNKKVSKDLILSTVLLVATSEYALVITCKKSKVGASITVSQIRVVMREYWRAAYGDEKKETGKDKEIRNFNCILLQQVPSVTNVVNRVTLRGIALRRSPEGERLNRRRDSSVNAMDAVKLAISMMTVGTIQRM